MFESVFDLVIQSAVTIILFLLAKFIYDIFTCRQTRAKNVPILKVDWEKDVVYLYQFPRANNIGYFKLGTNTLSFIETMIEGRAPTILKYVTFPLVYPNMWKMLNMAGTGRHSPEEVQTILRADLNAIDQILGDKKWIVGEEPSLADFAFFGQVAGSYNVPYDIPIQHMFDTEFPRLKAHHERMAKTYFSGVNFARCST
ncbi:cadmium-inducible lysosomal protein CDR-5 [Ditylenchus destructor]|nr:cadmium-inducible lysosomal protein CDR-5 [Ditylenchus destructor]